MAWAWYSDNVFVVAFTQEFTKHYAELTGVPAALRTGESFTVYGKVFKPGFKVTSVALFQEEWPRPMSLEELRVIRYTRLRAWTTWYHTQWKAGRM